MRGKREKSPLSTSRGGGEKIKHPVWWWSSVGRFTRRNNTSPPIFKSADPWMELRVYQLHNSRSWTRIVGCFVSPRRPSLSLSLSLCDQPSALLHSFTQPGSTKTECGVSLKWRSVSARGARDTHGTSAEQHRNLNAPLAQRCVQVPADSVHRALRCPPPRASHNVVAETNKYKTPTFLNYTLNEGRQNYIYLQFLTIITTVDFVGWNDDRYKRTYAVASRF